MRAKVFWGLAILASMSVLCCGIASANYIGTGFLTITDWYGQRVDVRTTIYDGTAGPWQWEWNGGPTVTDSPIYCLDLYGRFQWNVAYEMDLYEVPPDPPNPPPYNTDHAAWIYHNYGSAWVLEQTHQIGATPISQDEWAAGVQLALWEVAHDLDWYGEGGNWLNAGIFQLDGDNDPNATATASLILDVLFDGLDGGGNIEPPSTCLWYQPKGEREGGQGQLGQIPEPGTLILLGMGVLSFAGAAWRKRRQ